MQKILRLEALYCDSGGSDKVYALVLASVPPIRAPISTNANEPGATYQVIALYGPRGKTITFKIHSYVSQSTATVEFAKTLSQKMRKGYRPIDWREQRYGLVRALLDMDPNADLLPPAQLPAPSQPASPPAPVSGPDLARQVGECQHIYVRQTGSFQLKCTRCGGLMPAGTSETPASPVQQQTPVLQPRSARARRDLDL